MNAPERDLVIDVGNSRTKAALFLNGRLKANMIIANGDRNSLKEFIGERPLRASIVANVSAGDGAWAKDLKELAPGILLTGNTVTPLTMAYAEPDSLGADRLANCVGAWRMMPGRNVLVVDLGTCITYDVVEAEGVYRGGAISPGMAMRARAMNAFSARLPLVDPGEGVPILGDSTLSSLASGVHHGIVGELQGFITSYRQQYADLGVILTGGDALRFARALKNGIFAHPFLTLSGLHAILDHHYSVHGAFHGVEPAGDGGPGTTG